MTPTPETAATITAAVTSFITDWLPYVSAAFIVGLSMYTLRRLTRAGR